MNRKFWKALMMLIIVVACATTGASADAEEPSAPPTIGASKPIYVMGYCHIRIGKLLGGHFNIPYPVAAPAHGRYYFPEPTKGDFQVVDGFGVDCLDTSHNDGSSTQVLLDIRQDDGRWLHKDRDDNWVPFAKDEHASVIQFRGADWTGLGLLTDDTTGDEKQRVRHLSFCIAHGKYALCGDTPVSLLSRPRDSNLAKIKVILESVEFVDSGESASSAVIEPAAPASN